MAEPLRTCVATGKKLPQSTLLRMVCDPAVADPHRLVVVPDPARKLPGRGAWITPTEAAVTQAVARGALHRAFRRGGVIDATAVTAWVSREPTGGSCT
ncbi:YlxR family protein [Corynebacterium choanae]|uniref:YlxR domain-containing protein n=1 Tax=Corynebacterium choanae TaxID=1862358 RepID=A0A3G6JB64_9CORY|nr:YlxR family protein [Corynebacterium choanae]AZA13820.1 hypothetical protein CCHOA_07140 [Corynebacterium choanae]